ncbi:helix-turn-helix domain-containing protein [Patescibacteria group bacterium]|nr:helix-turn-helix domain-containing protein [Patescibacteria group bacterium]MBU0845694.1 helix-turn-helix domain-containing protein [Patescibacteria group bacterium]MBU0923081.1 helix-turn-helix domain-containing protein [Patescibacteria group bacterium]MBU1844898.1 helix-turn-helix domain-containing protein [Patescibacteria group bacterium]
MVLQDKLGKNIKKVRERFGLTQADIAEKAGIHVNYYARIERGEENPTFEVLEKIAKALKVKSSKILPF